MLKLNKINIGWLKKVIKRNGHTLFLFLLFSYSKSLPKQKEMILLRLYIQLKQTLTKIPQKLQLNIYTFSFETPAK